MEAETDRFFNGVPGVPSLVGVSFEVVLPLLGTLKVSLRLWAGLAETDLGFLGRGDPSRVTRKRPCCLGGVAKSPALVGTLGAGILSTA